MGPDREVRKETYYGLECPTIESLYGRYFLHLYKWNVRPPQPSVLYVLGLLQCVKQSGRSVGHTPDLVLRYKSRVQKKHLLPLFVLMACRRVNITIHYFIH